MIISSIVKLENSFTLFMEKSVFNKKGDKNNDELLRFRKCFYVKRNHLDYSKVKTKKCFFLFFVVHIILYITFAVNG